MSKVGEVMTEQELSDAPLGTRVSDWENDILEKEAPDAWFYAHQPIRGQCPREFSTEVIFRAYGPIKFCHGPRNK